MTANKGGDAIIHAMNLLRDEDFVFHIFGAIEPHYREILSAISMKTVIIHGGYDTNDLGRLYKPTTVSLHLSRWPETWCMALDEAWQHHIIPIVSDLGAPAARVVHGTNGFLVPPDDPAAVATLLRKLAASRQVLARMRTWIAAHPLNTADEHRRRLIDIYARLSTESERANNSSLPAACDSIDMRLCRTPMATPIATPAETRVAPLAGEGLTHGQLATRVNADIPPLIARARSYYAVNGFKRTAVKVVKYLGTR